MISKTQKNISYIVFGLVGVIILLTAGFHSNIIKLPYVVRMSSQYAMNLSDNRELVGSSHNIFVGKVIKQEGTQISNKIPYTLFSVEIIANIKGNLHGTVTIRQSGGYKDGILYIETGDSGNAVSEKTKQSNSDKYILQSGSIYLFATRGPSKEGYYSISAPPYDSKLISDDITLSLMQLSEIAKNDDRVKAMKIAYPDEVLMDADIAHNRTLNSFSSLPVEEQERIKAEVEQMKAGR